MRNFRFLFIIFFAGCSTMSVNSGPTFKAWEGKGGDYRHYVSTDFVETNAFAPSTSSNIMLECKYPLNNGKDPISEDPENLIGQECRSVAVGNHSAGVGVMPSVGGALVSAGGTIGAAYLVGKGLADSGDNNSMNNKSSSDSVNASESAGGAGGTARSGDDYNATYNITNKACDSTLIGSGCQFD